MSEQKNCQSCKKSFLIEPEDFDFYKRLKVPAPTFCPDCRRQRRLTWFNLVNLFHRNCDLCGERFISMYPKEAPYVVYCPPCFWSDKWDWRDYGRDYDFSRPFFEQWRELLQKAPLLGLSINSTTTQGSPYNNHATNLKRCYLTFDSGSCEDCAYGVLMEGDKEVFNSSMAMDCESCFDCMNLFKSSRCVGTRGNIRFCMDSFFLRDCDNCSNCFMCANLKNGKYCFKNKPLSKEEYEKKLAEYELHTSNGYARATKEAHEFWQSFPPRPSYDVMSQNVTGSYIFNSNNCKECYDVTGCENCKYCMMMYRTPQKDCYDISHFGYNLQNSCESGVVGENSSNIRFCQESGLGLIDAEYCKLSLSGGTGHFGCVSVKKGEYVIFNKQYTKEEYYALREKIVRHMDEMPYRDVKGNVYKYGEFFPLEFSPFPYNITFANLFYPRTKDEIDTQGSWFLEDEERKYAPTMKSGDLPGSAKHVDESILKETIECEKCSKGFKIIEMELRFLKKEGLPLPRECPFCRMHEKLMLWVDNMTLKDRVCDKCGVGFKTHYSKERAPKILCKSCYQSEFS